MISNPIFVLLLAAIIIKERIAWIRIAGIALGISGCVILILFSSKIQNKNSSELSAKYNLNKIKLPPGFQISVYAEVPNARSLALSPSGIIYAGNRNGNKVFAIVDEDKDGKADKVYTIASGLNTPNGVAFKDIICN